MKLNTTKNLRKNKGYYKIVNEISITENRLKKLREKKKIQAFKMSGLRLMT